MELGPSDLFEAFTLYENVEYPDSDPPFRVFDFVGWGFRIEFFFPTSFNQGGNFLAMAKALVGQRACWCLMSCIYI